MNVHKNAPLTPKSRESWPEAWWRWMYWADAAYQFNTTRKQRLAKWVKRFRAEGVEGSRDRSSRPHHRRAKLRHAPMAVHVAGGVWLGDEWGLEERSRNPSTPSARNRLTHLATVFRVVLNW